MSSFDPAESDESVSGESVSGESVRSDAAPAPTVAAELPAIGSAQSGDEDRSSCEEATDERLDFRVVPAWMMSGLVSLAVLAALGVGATGLFGSEIRSEVPWLPTAGLGLFALLALWTVLQPFLAWQRWRFRVDDKLLSARYGIVFHEEKIIPMSRLQHVDLTRGPIERAFGLATLIVHTAGSEGATFRLPGLRDARARALREQVLEARGDDVV